MINKAISKVQCIGKEKEFGSIYHIIKKIEK
jgi:hypothetical protein